MGPTWLVRATFTASGSWNVLCYVTQGLLSFPSSPVDNYRKATNAASAHPALSSTQPGQYSYVFVADNAVTTDPGQPTHVSEEYGEVHRVSRGGGAGVGGALESGLGWHVGEQDTLGGASVKGCYVSEEHGSGGVEGVML